jgi:hypothetical protein
MADRWGIGSLGTLNGTFGAPITAVTALAPVGGVLLAGWTGSCTSGAGVLTAVVALGVPVILASNRQLRAHVGH